MATQLYFKVDGRWRSTLTIPKDDFNRFTTRPLAWLRFLGYAIYGRDGILKMRPNGQEVNSYDTDVADLNSQYYYVSPDPHRLVDPQAIKDRTSDVDSVARSQQDFREALITRDGTCIITGENADDCDASHCLSHSNGDQYIQDLTTYRGDSEADIVADINDPKNGLLIWRMLHGHVGKGRSAFLRTPNLSMTVNDVPLAPPEAATRLTLQHLFKLPPGITSQHAPNNSDARKPQDLSQWPTDLIVDFIYGAAAFKKWGTQAAIQLFIKKMKDTYYTGKVRKEKARKAPVAKVEMSKRDRDARLSNRTTRASGSGAEPEGEGEPERNWEEMMDIVHYFWSQPPASGTKSSLQDVNKERVEAWLHGK